MKRCKNMEVELVDTFAELAGNSNSNKTKRRPFKKLLDF